METQQILIMLARIEAKMVASHKKMMAVLDAHHERIMASLGKMEAMDWISRQTHRKWNQ
jgi:hypothetical protein